MIDPAVTPPPLPQEARRELLRLAAHVLGALPDADVPASLRRVRAFTPARRAEAGGSALAAALDREPVFRQAVAGAWRAGNPELADALDRGEPPAAADPTAVLVGLHLLRGPQWHELAASISEVVVRRRESEEAAAAAADAASAARAAVRETERITQERDEAREQVRGMSEELATLRRDARRLRSDADRSRAQARAAETAVAQALLRAQETASVHEETIHRLESKLAEAEAAVHTLRQHERDARLFADVRVRLLLDTILEAGAGLRRELALPPQTTTPADLVAPDRTADVPAVTAGVPVRAQDADDPAWLDQLLGLPRVHLVVDGYNVTKTGYGDLTLLEQRRRLVDGLASLLARTHAEITCCFDGAEVESSQATRVRGVRVLFSDPGTTADDLVRRLVRAEPRGRPVVVVSSDGEVAAGVRAAGARCVPAVALLRLLARS